MDSKFYKAFEEQFRGPRETILERLQVYLPFIMPLLDIYPSASALDLGCGRGEWLELLTGHGFQGIGVDINDEMLKTFSGKEVMIHSGDALAFIKDLPDESQAIISAFHFIEHISFEHLGTLVKECYRVLQPQGILLFETPNCENLNVGSSFFFYDPTHIRPIPNPTLKFLVEYFNFQNVKIIGCQGPNLTFQSEPSSLMNLFKGGVSPDYGLIAQKVSQEKGYLVDLEVFHRSFGNSHEDVCFYSDEVLRQMIQRIAQQEVRQSSIFYRVKEKLSYWKKQLREINA